MDLLRYNALLLPLSPHYLKGAIALAERVFPQDRWSLESPRLAFWMSLHQESVLVRFLMRTFGLRSLAYWVVSENGTVVATTGLYRYRGDKQGEVNLGWFCVAPEMRGAGLGRKVLEWTMMRAQIEGAKTLKLYTSNSSNEAAAQKLYESVGLTVVREEPHGEYIYMYREKKF